ncbi:MAG: superoxide dismutase family protein [bacterium]|nr:superoxide dismutase family protein [bacterium]
MTLTLHSDNLTETMQASADITGPSINGNLELTEYDINGAKYVKVEVKVEGDPNVLKPGVHAVHFHEKAACDCEGFKCAGGHFDPGPSGNTDADANHGYHAGDLPSITIGEDGKGELIAYTTRVTLSDGPVSLLSKKSAPEGTSIMIHGNPDPYTPGESGSGHSGGPRLACGTIEVG